MPPLARTCSATADARCVLLALAGGIAAALATASAYCGMAAAPPTTVSVLVAIEDIPAGTRLDAVALARFVRVVRRPAAVVPSHALSDPDSVRDRWLVRVIRAGATISARDIPVGCSYPARTRFVSADCPAESLALARTGDRVDVWVTVRVGGATEDVRLLAGVLVLGLIPAERDGADGGRRVALAADRTEGLIVELARATEGRFFLRPPEAARHDADAVISFLGLLGSEDRP